MMTSVDETLSLSLEEKTRNLIKDKYPQVRKWINVRRGIRQSVTKTLKSILVKNFTDLDEVKALKQKCLDSQENISRLDGLICDEMNLHKLWDDDTSDKESANCESYMDDLRLSISKLNSIIDKLERTLVIQPSGSFHPKMSLPKLHLPTFDGSAEKYSRFITQFEAVIDKFTLSSFEKFSYLENQLTGSARTLLDAVPAESLQYEVAKKLLDRAFMNEDVQKFAILDKLVNLKFTVSDPFKWISEINMLKDQVDKQKIDTNFFVQYFAWNSLSEPFKQQLIGITNVSRPSLQQIIDNAFEANTRMREVGFSLSNSSIEPRAIALATTVDKTAKGVKVTGELPLCSLCSKTGHFARDCSVFSTPVKKLEQAKNLGLCFKCARKHAGKCFGLTRPCSKYKNWHFDYMCDVKSKEVSKQKTSKKKNSYETSKTQKFDRQSGQKAEATSNSIILQVNDNLDKDVLLPTFTANLIGDSVQLEARSVYDPWSQTTFIKESLADRLKCKVLQHVDLSVRGFNCRKDSKAKVVEVSVLIGDKKYLINAVTVPEFELSITAPNLDKVVHGFRVKGYRLADRYLANGIISDFEFMLGSNFAGILPVTTTIFKYNDQGVPSCYFDTPLGVMLQGSVGLILKNLDGLEDLTSKIQAS